MFEAVCPRARPLHGSGRHGSPMNESEGGELSAKGVRRALKQSAVAGGLWSATRESGGLVIRLGGMLLLTSLLGPADFGRYVGVTVLVMILAYGTQLGAEVWIIRRQIAPDRHALKAVRGLLLVTSGTAVSVGLAAAVLAQPLVDDRTLTAFVIVLVSLPLNVLWAPAQGLLERNLRYRSLTFLELAGDITLYGVGLTLAVLFDPLYGAALGFVAWRVWLLVGSYRLCRMWPSIGWDSAMARDLLRFGSRWSSGLLLQTGAQLVNPIVVGSVLGATAVGQVALAQRLLEALSFAGRAALRLGLPLLSRVAQEPARLSRALDAGTALQTLAVGVPLTALVAVSPVLVPLAFGDGFGPTVDVLPLMALGATVSAAFVLQTSLLGVRHREGVVARTYLLLLLLRLGTAALAVPAFGILGYAIAEAVAVIGWLLCDRATRREVDRSLWGFLPLALILPLLASSSVPLMTWPLLALPAAVCLVTPSTRRRLHGPVRQVVTSARPSAPGLP